MRALPRTRPILWTGVALASIVLAGSGATASGTVGLSLVPPYAGIGVQGSHSGSVVGCATNSSARELVRPTFNSTSGRASLGSRAAVGCGSTSGVAQSVALESVVLHGPTFRELANRPFWVNVSWNLTFTYTARDVCPAGCNQSNFGKSSYRLWINASLWDLTTNKSNPLLPGFLNASSVGAPRYSVTYSNAPVHLSFRLGLVVGDRYRFVISATEMVIASAIGPTGHAVSQLDLGTPGHGAWLTGISVA